MSAAASVVQDTANAYFEVQDLKAYYGDSYIVQGLSLSVNEGEIVALLGRNGAGKTSTLRAIARAASPELRSGSIYLQGQSIHDKQDFEAALAGIQLVPEDRRIIPGLTVEENLNIARISGEAGWEYERIYSLFPRLKERRKQEATTLSGGEQQRLAIGRASTSSGISQGKLEGCTMEDSEHGGINAYCSDTELLVRDCSSRRNGQSGYCAGGGAVMTVSNSSSNSDVDGCTVADGGKPTTERVSEDGVVKSGTLQG